MSNKIIWSLKNFFKSFTPYQIIYLASVFALTIGFVIFLPGEMLEDTSNTPLLVCSVISTLSNPVCELLLSKQSRLNFVVDILFIEIPEFILCISLGWYTIAIVTILFWIPIDILSYIKWVRNKDEIKDELTVVKKLSYKQDILVIAAIAAFTLIVGNIIKLLPGAADSYIDALAAACGMANGILILLRYTEQWYAWFATLIFYTILYTTSGTYIMLITVAAMFVNTCYGFAKWVLYSKNHPNKQNS